MTVMFLSQSQSSTSRLFKAVRGGKEEGEEGKRDLMRSKYSSLSSGGIISGDIPIERRGEDERTEAGEFEDLTGAIGIEGVGDGPKGQFAECRWMKANLKRIKREQNRLQL
jgi:hypothetical protein